MNRRRAIAGPFRLATALALGLALALDNPGVSHASDLVDVPDAKLAACLATDLARQGIDTELTAANLAKLDWLTCSGVADLTGVSHLTGMAHLNLFSSTVGELTQLHGLEALETAILESTAPLSLTPLTTLPKLDKLALILLDGTDAAPLAGLSTLTTLQVTLGAGRMDAFPIPASVTELELGRAPSLATLSPAPGVRSFTVSGSLTSLDGIDALPGLSSLTVRGGDSRIADLSPLAGLTGLTDFALHSRELSDLSPLAGLTKLAGLDLSHSRISSLAPLRGLRELTTLKLADNELTSVAPLAGLDELATVDVSDNQLTDLSPVSGHDSLTRLNAAENELTSLGTSGSLRSLSSVDLGRNQLTSIAALTGAPLAWAYLSLNKLSDLTPLSGAAPDLSVTASHNRIADLSPLPDGAAYRITDQDLGRLGEAKVKEPIALGVLGVDGTPLCPSGTSDPSSCSAGSIAYPTPGVYSGSFAESRSGSSYSATYTQHAGPDLAFTKVPKVSKLSKLNTRVGASLFARTGVWAPQPTRVDYQWYVGGVLRVAGQANYYYDLTPSDLGKRVKACAVAHRNGYADTRICSKESTPVRLGDLWAETSPKITGTAVVGKTLTLKPGTWTAGTKLRYQWMRNGHAIKGATGLTYRLKAKDARTRIQVKVTGTQYGYHSYFVYTKAVRPKR